MKKDINHPNLQLNISKGQPPNASGLLGGVREVQIKLTYMSIAHLCLAVMVAEIVHSKVRKEENTHASF